MIQADISRKIERFATSHPDIVAVYVFGSTATDRKRAGSDIDIAIMIREPMGSIERVQMETELSNVLGKDVDLVVFNQASPLLQHQILKYGFMVLETDARERIRQEVISRSSYLDSLRLYRFLS